MNIVGLDTLIFGVTDVPACTQYLIDYGLVPVGVNSEGGCFEAADGTSVILKRRDDPSLPPAMETPSMLRKTVYGVADRQTLEAIALELGKDREVRKLPDGSIEALDDLGFVLGFQVTIRRPFQSVSEVVNTPGSIGGRPANVLGVEEERPVKPQTLSHVVYFVPDVPKAESFYVKRLGFRCTDRLLGAGPFLQPGGMLDHHALFLIQTPPHMKGIEHFTFHFSGPTDVMLAGTRFVNKGYQAFWGPGRHKFGSNWFWYFNSPFGCHVEFDADMDLHDKTWQAREAPMSADASQAFLLEPRQKWAPMGPPPGAAKG